MHFECPSIDVALGVIGNYMYVTNLKYLRDAILSENSKGTVCAQNTKRKSSWNLAAKHGGAAQQFSIVVKTCH